MHNKINQVPLDVAVSCHVLHFQSGKELSLFAFVFFPLSSTLSLFYLQSICMQSKMFLNCYFGLSKFTRASQHKQYSNSTPTLFCYKLKKHLCKTEETVFACSQTRMKRSRVHACVKAVCFGPDCVKADLYRPVIS